MRRQRLAPLTPDAACLSPKSPPSRKFYASAAVMTAVTLWVLLALCFAVAASADDQGPDYHLGAIAIPYWESEPMNGEIQALAVTDLDAKEGKGKILVGQVRGSIGELAVLNSDRTLLRRYPTEQPVLAIGVFDLEMDKQPAVKQRVVVLALKNAILAVRAADLLSPTLSLTSTRDLLWRWPPPKTDEVPDEVRPSGTTRLLMADVTGDGKPEVLRVTDHVLVLDIAGREVTATLRMPADASALTVVDQKILVGTLAGKLYNLRENSEWSESLCKETPILSLGSGSLRTDSSHQVVVGCKGYLDIRDPAGGVLWRQSVPGFEVQTLFAPTASVVTFTVRGSAVTLLEDGSGVRIIRSASGITDVIRYDTNGAPGIGAVGDVNGDGVNELAVSAGRTVRLYGYSVDALSDGWRQVFDVFRSADQQVSIRPAFGDLDNDGVLGWAIASGTDASNGYIYTGGESKPARVAFVPHGLPTAVAMADLNADGKDDIVVGSTEGLYLSLTGQEPFEKWPTAEPIDALALGDLNGDLAKEVVVQSGGSLKVFSPTTREWWDNPIENTNSKVPPIVGDVDGDGVSDVLLSLNDGAVSAYSWNQAGRQGIWPESRQLSGTVSALIAADLDRRDSKLDVIAVAKDPSSEKSDKQLSQIHVLDGGTGETLWQHEIAEFASVAAGDVNGDGQSEVLVGTNDGIVHVLRHGPPDGAGREIAPVKVGNGRPIGGLLAVNIDDIGRAAVFAWTLMGGDVYALQDRAEGSFESIGRYSVGADIVSVTGIDLDKDRVSEVFALTKDGRGYLRRKILNQPLLILNTEHSADPKDSGRHKYSAYMVDPEDKLPVVLAFSNPGKPPWNLSEILSPLVYTRTYDAAGSIGRLEWDVNPFEEWDAGRKSRPSLVYSEGKKVQSLELPEILIPGPKREFVYGALAVLVIGAVSGVVYGIRRERRRSAETRRRWAASPQGQAESLYACIEKAPERLLVEIGHVVAHRDDAAQILTELHVLCTRKDPRCATAAARVVQGYARLLGGVEEWKAGLGNLLSGLPALSGVEAEGEALVYCRLLNVASTANSVARMAAMRSQIDAALGMASVALPGFSDLKGALEQWSRIVGHLENYQRTATNEEKIRYLGHAITELSQIDRQISSGALREPERAMLREIAALWLDTVNNALDELRGRADLRVSIPTQRLLALDSVVVALALRNEGSADAGNVRVELLPSEQYEILESDGKAAGVIPATQTRSVEFQVRPRTTEGFRAEFRVTYDDLRGTGRRVSFGDRVILISTNEQYRPIPNPYQAGRPLPKGSPLFFGREDVFAFIAGNVGSFSSTNVLVLIGQRRSGKTSLLKQLPSKLDQRFVPVYIDGQQLGIDPGMANLFCGLSQIIASELMAAGIEVAAPAREEFEPAPSQVFEQGFLARVEEALGDRRLLLAFDEFEEIEARVREGNVDRTIFPFLRHLMQHSEKLAFIFVGIHKLEELSKDYWSIFFNIALHKQIRFLDAEAARQLIREPVAGAGLVYDDLAVERILEITAGHPYFVQLMCHALVNFANANKRNFITVEDVRTVVDETIALGEAHFAWIWGLATPKDQLVLATLTSLLRDQAVVTSSAIASTLAEQRQPMDPAEVSDILSQLAAQDLVEEIPDHVLQYRFKLEIISLWIRRNRPLSRVIEEVTVRVPYRSVTCPGCSKQFDRADQRIVICPECGERFDPGDQTKATMDSRAVDRSGS